MHKALKWRGWWVIGLPFLAMLFTVVGHGHAQVPGDFNLVSSPLPILLSAKPGETVSSDLRVKNASPTSEKLKVTLFKFNVNDRGQVELKDRQPGDDYFNWVSFDKPTFTAGPNEWRTVKMTIKLPKTAALGYYYAVGFSQAGEPQPTPGAATLKGQLITFVLLDAEVPWAKRQLKVDEFKASQSTYEYLPASLSVKVRNTGNIHVVPRGNIFIMRGNKTVSTLDVNSSFGNVLPNSWRQFSVDWDQGFPVYKVQTENGRVLERKDATPDKKLTWDFAHASQLRIGKYTAKLVLVYNDGQHDIPIQGQVSFWVLPWKIILGFIVILVFIGIGVFSFGRNIWRRLKKRRR